ncbi:MAG: type II toxin-antitoxin system VapC family toxin [Candidatus Dormibacteraceae bacterium]
MRLLLDTHVFLWLATDPARLGDRIGLLEDRRNDVLLSAASAWGDRHQVPARSAGAPT